MSKKYEFTKERNLLMGFMARKAFMKFMAVDILLKCPFLNISSNKVEKHLSRKYI